MKSLLAITFVTLSFSFCNSLSNRNNSNNSNSSKTATAKDRFMGAWEVAPESSPDSNEGPITFKEDGTYTAQRTTDPNSSMFSGGYTIKDNKLYCDGELKEFTEGGFSLEGDNRMKLPRGSKTLYFVKK